jgi:hypothetical protein
MGVVTPTSPGVGGGVPTVGIGSVENVGGGDVGATEGAAVGDALGVAVGAAVGVPVGAAVGVAVGVAVGDALGVAVGDALGAAVGDALGVLVGDDVGAVVGASEGAAVGKSVHSGRSGVGESVAAVLPLALLPLPPMPGVVLSDDGVGAAVGSPVGDDVGVWVGGHMHSGVGDVLPSPMPMPGDEDDDDDDDDAEPPPPGVTVRPCRASGDSPDASLGRADVGTGASAVATAHATTQQKRRRVVVGTDRAMVLQRVQPKRCACVRWPTSKQLCEETHGCGVAVKSVSARPR